MRTTTLLSALAAVALLAPAGARAQTIALSLKPESRVFVQGTSTMHDFHCASSRVTAAITADAAIMKRPPVASTRPVGGATVTVPARSLDCGKGKMNDNMFKVIDADQFATISYNLTKIEITRGTTADAEFGARATGTLTLRGQTKPITMDIVGTRQPDGAIKAVGSTKILLTTFGIKPPSFMMGALKVGDALTVGFDVTASAGQVAALAQP